jgi:hypothetical protein
MLWKAVLTLALMAALVPRGPDLGPQAKPDFTIARLERAHDTIVAALDRVRSDLKAHGGGR